MACFFSTAQAQFPTVIGLPTAWGQYESILPLVQPAYAGKSEDFTFSIGNLRHFGLWKNNQTFFVHGNTRVYGKLGSDSTSRSSFHSIGGYLIGEDEGQYLHRTRGYGSYAFHLKLNQRLTLSAGVSLGMMNYSVSANDFTSGGSSSTLDGNIGLLLYSSTSYIGFSSNQIFEGYVSPIQERTKLLRHWYGMVGTQARFSPWIMFRPSVLVGILPGLYPNVAFGFTSIWGKYLMVGCNVRLRDNFTLIVGLEKVSFASSSINATFSYSIPMAAYTSSARQTFELIITYALQYKIPLFKPKSTYDESYGN